MKEEKIYRFNRIMKLSLPLVAILAALLLHYEGCFVRDKADDMVYHHKQGMVFGTVYNITYSHADSVDLQPQIESAFAAVNNSLSMFNKQSVISRVNNNDSTVELDSLFVRVFNRGQEISALTDGAFDMTVAPLVDLWGFGIEDRVEVDPLLVDSVMRYVGYDKVTIEGGRLFKVSQSIKLDAGAIAKGFACDVVADTLKAYGSDNICVEIGGELVVYGNNPSGKAWRIGINKPVEDSTSYTQEIQEVIEMEGGAMATSGNYRNYYIDSRGRKVSHTINPKTGYTVEQTLLSATIIAEDCMTADALATSCMVMGLDRSKELVRSLDGVKAYFIYGGEDGEMKVWDSVE